MDQQVEASPKTLQNSFAQAWNVLNQAKLIFAALLILALVIDMACFLAVRFGKVTRSGLAPIPATYKALTDDDAPAATMPAKQAQSADPAVGDDESSSSTWVSLIALAMNLSRILALVAVGFLLFCAMLMVMVLIAGHMPGAGPAVSAFFWAVFLVVLILPWFSLIPATLDQLDNALEPMFTGGDWSWISEISVWIRFVAYPLIAVLVTVMYLGRLSQANLQIIQKS